MSWVKQLEIIDVDGELFEAIPKTEYEKLKQDSETLARIKEYIEKYNKGE